MRRLRRPLLAALGVAARIARCHAQREVVFSKKAADGREGMMRPGQTGKAVVLNTVRSAKLDCI